MPRLPRVAVALSFVVALATVGVGCKQGVGDRCEHDEDCESGLICRNSRLGPTSTEGGKCEDPRTTPQDASTGGSDADDVDAPADASTADAGADAPATSDAAPSDDAADDTAAPAADASDDATTD